MFLLLAALAQASAEPVFPERSPALIKACLVEAAASNRIEREKGELKYICGGAPAEALWAFLEATRVEAWQQETKAEGIWLSRSFVLGGCFKRLRLADGSPATSGLSCSVWVAVPER